MPFNFLLFPLACQHALFYLLLNYYEIVITKNDKWQYRFSLIMYQCSILLKCCKRSIPISYKCADWNSWKDQEPSSKLRKSSADISQLLSNWLLLYASDKMFTPREIANCIFSIPCDGVKETYLILQFIIYFCMNAFSTTINGTWHRIKNMKDSSISHTS